MNTELPEYWSRMRKTALGWVHPDDEELFGSVAHSFNLDFPPPAFVGDVTRAKIIILAANGGYKPDVTPKEFDAPGSEARYMNRISNPGETNWSEVAPYYDGVNYADLIINGTAALVNVCAYRSRKISEEPENKRLLARLPSVNFHRTWLLETIFPQIESGKRVVVGKRHGLWSLPASVKTCNGFIADPAPISPHLSNAVWERLQRLIGPV
ncbi:MAG: hypothetical protein AMXMBFR26_17020 [Porticoccaceae bacterium]